MAPDSSTKAVIRQHQHHPRSGTNTEDPLTTLSIPKAGKGAELNVVGGHLYLERDGTVLLGQRHPGSSYAGASLDAVDRCLGPVHRRARSNRAGGRRLPPGLSTSRQAGLRSVPADLDPRVTRHGRFSLAFTFDAEAFGNISISSFRAVLRAEGIPVGLRDLIACPDEPIYADGAAQDYSNSRTVSCTQARAACTRLVLFGQATGSGMLLEDPSELTDVVRAVEKVHDNCGQLREAKYQRATTHVPSDS